ncbi:MAG: hypothetical protein JWR73_960 [Tardiphaga sp.]|nr:hypothetical protein [Tardiphaga sp.]
MSLPGLTRQSITHSKFNLELDGRVIKREDARSPAMTVCSFNPD